MIRLLNWWLAVDVAIVAVPVVALVVLAARWLLDRCGWHMDLDGLSMDYGEEGE
jgi:hypothetical protein